MNKSRIVFLSAAVAAGIGLSSCGGPGQAGEAGQGTAVPSSAAADPAEAFSPAAATAGAAGAATSTPFPSASAAPPAPKPAVTPAPTVTPTPTAAGPEGPAALASFTFPDGHLSFSYPATWTIRVETSSPSANRAPGVDPVVAVLADATGNELLAITSNADGGDGAGPVLRTVLDTAPVPGLKDTSGEQLDFGFAFDSFADHAQFHMGIRKSRDFQPSPESSGSARVALGNGDLDTHVFFDTPAFPSIDAAKAWMATKQYGELKQLLLSTRYQ